MRKVSLFIAMSLDGYIADNKGGVDWLEGQGDNNENMDSYSEFVKNIDTVVMGWNTYYQVATELSPKEWVYSDFTTYVITHNKHTSSEKIRFTSTNPVDLIKSLKKEYSISATLSSISKNFKKNFKRSFYRKMGGVKMSLVRDNEN